MPYSQDRISELARIALTPNNQPLKLPRFTIETRSEPENETGAGRTYRAWVQDRNYARSLGLPLGFTAGTLRDGIPLDETEIVGDEPAPIPNQLVIGFGIGDDTYLYFWYRVDSNGALRYERYTARHRDGRSIIQVVLPFALAFAGIAGFMGPLINAIGNAILPANFAAAYPALVPAVGNIAFTTALNGGDVQSAIQSAGMNVIASTAGANVADVFDSRALGAAAAAATKAALAGGNIGQAALIGAASQGFSSVVKPGTSALDLPKPGASNMDFSLSTDSGTGISVPSNIWSGGFTPSGGINPAAGAADGIDLGSGGWNLPGLSFDTGGGSLLPAGWDTGAPASGGGSFNYTDALKNITNTAMAALTLVRAYKGGSVMAAGQPTSQGTVRANPDGSVTYTNATGSRTGIPPAGQAYAIGDGRMIINNGDGTYTLIGVDGSRTIQRYPQTALPVGGSGSIFGSGGITLPLLIGGGVLLALALSRRR